MHMFNNVSVCFFKIFRMNRVKAFTYKFIGRNNDALKYCEKELNDNGRSKRTLKMKVEILFKLQRYEDVIASCDEFIGLYGERADVKRVKGKALCDLGKMDEAANLLKEILGSNPRDSETLVLLARVMLKMNRYEDAITCCDKAIKYNENAFEAYDLRQNALGEMGIDEEAISQEEKDLTRKAVKEVFLGDDEYECEEFDCEKMKHDACLFISSDVNV